VQREAHQAEPCRALQVDPAGAAAGAGSSGMLLAAGGAVVALRASIKTHPALLPVDLCWIVWQITSPQLIVNADVAAARTMGLETNPDSLEASMINERRQRPTQPSWTRGGAAHARACRRMPA
jgi:hypothetical protein